jgi:hypothetical protein
LRRLPRLPPPDRTSHLPALRCVRACAPLSSGQRRRCAGQWCRRDDADGLLRRPAASGRPHPDAAPDRALRGRPDLVGVCRARSHAAPAAPGLRAGGASARAGLQVPFRKHPAERRVLAPGGLAACGYLGESLVGGSAGAAVGERGAAPAPPAGALPPAPPAGRCPCTPAKRRGAWRPFSLGNLSSGLCAPCETECRATRSMGAACSRACQTACAPVAAHVCTKHRDEEHEAASGPSAAHGWTEDRDEFPTAAPGPSRTCASGEAAGLGACNLWWLVRTIACPFAAAAAAAAGRDGIRKQQVQPTRSRSWYLGGRERGWQRGATGGRFHPPNQVTYAQPRGLPRCTSARGPRRCQGVPVVVLCAHLCSAGTRRCPVLPRRRHGCTIVQRRARTQFDKHVNTRPPWSVWPGTSSRAVHKARMRDCQERRGG